MSLPDALLRLQQLNRETAPIWEQASALAAYEAALPGKLSAAAMSRRVGEGYTPRVVASLRSFRTLSCGLQDQFRRLGLGSHLVDEVARFRGRGLSAAQIDRTMAGVPQGYGAGAEVKRQLYAMVEGGAQGDLVRRLTRHLHNYDLPEDAKVDGDRVVLGPAAVGALLCWLDARGGELAELRDSAEEIKSALAAVDPDGDGVYELGWLVKGLEDAGDEARNLTSAPGR